MRFIQPPIDTTGNVWTERIVSWWLWSSLCCDRVNMEESEQKTIMGERSLDPVFILNDPPTLPPCLPPGRFTFRWSLLIREITNRLDTLRLTCQSVQTPESPQDSTSLPHSFCDVFMCHTSSKNVFEKMSPLSLCRCFFLRLSLPLFYLHLSPSISLSCGC